MLKPKFSRFGVELYRRDCVSLIKFLPEGSIDLTVTSPPYDDLRTYSKRIKWDWNYFKRCAKGLYRVTKDGGVVVWNVGDQVVEGSETGTSFRQALYFKRCGFKLHDTMIWQKPNFSNPASNRYHQVFEYVFILVKGNLSTFNPICDRPNIESGKIGNFGKNTVTQTDGSKRVRPKRINSEYGMRHNVWLMKTAGQTQESRIFKHPAMFTIEFASDHIRTWSNPKDTVFDPFMGSGTTAVAAKRLGRKIIGCEVSSEYIRTQIKRLSMEL